MRICVLDGKKVENKEILHDHLAESLDFPKWYGRNLDALYDCLTDMQEESEIRLRNEKDLTEHLGKYANILKKVLCLAAKDHGKIHVVFEDLYMTYYEEDQDNF